MILNVYVPAGEDLFGIAPGSAIVGAEWSDGDLRVDYEGGIYDQAGFESFDRRAMQAAGRHISNHPTSARLRLPQAALQAVGTYDTDTWTFRVDNQPALN